jgi:hypothetical protein
MATYETAGRLLSLANIDQKLLDFYFPDKLIRGTESIDLAKKRKEMITTIAWWATASHPQLLSSQNQADLLKIVDRRLRVAERMLYHVAENLHGSNLPDGANRIFEYPDEGASPSLSADAATAWDGPSGTENYRFTRKLGTTASNALTELFKPHATVPERNRLFCDQVIQSLHLESFMVSERNSRNGDDTWFNTLADGKLTAWLRVDSPWDTKGTFLVSPGETSFFEHKSIGIADLQVGDHLIVYNHPLFSALLPDSAWGLENSIVVQVYPEPKVQGHGIMPKTLAGLKNHLLDKTNTQLQVARDKVEVHALVTNPTENQANLYPTIDINTKCKAVRRVPPSQSAWASTPDDCRMADWWLRWAPLDGRVAEKELYTQPAGDAYWDGRRAHARKHQGIEIVIRDTFPNADRNGFFFPLWEAQTEGTGQNEKPVTDAQGKKKLLYPSIVDEPMASLANFYYPSDFHRGTTTVIRPKVN